MRIMRNWKHLEGKDGIKGKDEKRSEMNVLKKLFSYVLAIYTVGTIYQGSYVSFLYNPSDFYVYKRMPEKVKIGSYECTKMLSKEQLKYKSRWELLGEIVMWPFTFLDNEKGSNYAQIVRDKLYRCRNRETGEERIISMQNIEPDFVKCYLKIVFEK